MDYLARLIIDSYDLLESKPMVSLALACIAIDASLKKYNKLLNPADKGVGERYKLFLRNHMPIILSTGNIKIIAKGEVKIGNKTLQEIIYKRIRCSLLHDGYIDDSIRLGEEIGREGQIMFLPYSIVEGLILSVVLSDANKDIKSKESCKVLILDKVYHLKDVWGRNDIFYNELQKLTNGKY
ncbi:hypothetical protein SAMN05660649_05188 [Desulfotomaculum arcticum]|uniref:Uncharacterized protein n=1 Tax=Desulfotruncus arcticus DSM 17038 TaxID=1121424 RepID=A0A1I3A054_9FIRM|nr:hypothetical protein [Desulfotruncus arcticus]SFH43487.1 hypothetical protein SAMN05660649_05188 [Desulfotomaculum arcticum] [Desulfotruncus arcticus DSM 17038]